MPQQKGYERMRELIDSLRSSLGRLESGELGLDELQRATEEARALYERLVVLRHKARESAVAAPPRPPTPLVKEPLIPEREPMRLDTRPPEVSPHQTSLIDAIAETEVGADEPASSKTVTDKPRVAKPKSERTASTKERPVTLADKIEHAPVADLHKAIALSQKFWFVAELFGGQRELYDKTIDAINGMPGLADAQALVEREVVGKLAKPPGEDVLATFMELLQRRFR